ncbi:hypothetical protein EYF80_021986 [Liparis tanakae]|uniref:Uncharacterized protein n=1 Tax=Liparis tanakae TaxID=230148 RepID=A0A4Z2HSM2_9TELE|nr:hypothetical protein EYF80_021986 [Liparis tanakae]
MQESARGSKDWPVDGIALQQTEGQREAGSRGGVAMCGSQVLLREGVTDPDAIEGLELARPARVGSLSDDLEGS